MILTEEDIIDLESLGKDRADFSLLTEDGFRMLKNVDNMCVFLNEDDRCSVYKHRPVGCRLYPFTYDLDTHEIVLDFDCPHPNNFVKVEELMVRTVLERLVETLFSERDKRLEHQTS